MADFDFSALTAETAELPKRDGGRTRKIQDNPFVRFVQDSYDTKSGRAVTVPKSVLKDTERLIRTAAADLGLGVRIVTSLKGEALEKAGATKQIKVSFQGQEKRKYAPRKAKGETTPETPAQS